MNIKVHKGAVQVDFNKPGTERMCVCQCDGVSGEDGIVHFLREGSSRSNCVKNAV